MEAAAPAVAGRLSATVSLISTSGKSASLPSALFFSLSVIAGYPLSVVISIGGWNYYYYVLLLTQILVSLVSFWTLWVRRSSDDSLKKKME